MYVIVISLKELIRYAFDHLFCGEKLIAFTGHRTYEGYAIAVLLSTSSSIKLNEGADRLNSYKRYTQKCEVLIYV